MKNIRYFLIFSIVVIYAVTVFAVEKNGYNWPIIYFGDMLNLDWRSQFNADFLIHLCLFAIWVSWREGFSLKGHILGFLSIIMGGMVGFPYILITVYQAEGDPKKVLLGVHSEK